MNQDRTTDQGGTSTAKPKINSYQGGAVKPRPRKMTETDAMLAASASVDKSVNAVKNITKEFDRIHGQTEDTIKRFADVADRIPTYIDANLSENTKQKIDGLEKTIKEADFSTAMTRAVDKATSGWIGEHKTAAWTIVICSVLLCVAFACLGISTAVKQGRAEEKAEHYKTDAMNWQKYKVDAMNWRQFAAENPRTAARFLKQKEQP